MNKNKKFQKINIDNIGVSYLRHSSKIKRIKISINMIGDLMVVIPINNTSEDAIRFMKSNIKWIKDSKNRIYNKKINIINFDFNDNLLNDFKLKIKLKTDQICIKHNFKYNKIYFKNMTSRWGSCSSKNNISFNNLMYHLDNDLQDYIIKHELLHTKIKNHSNIFWHELEKICENSKHKNSTINKFYFIKYY